MTVRRVAVIQHPPVVLDLEASLSRAEHLVAEAADGGADLVVFPETWLPGYPSWAFGLAGWDDQTAKQAHARLLRNALTVPGPALDVLTKMAAQHSVHLVMGVNELSTDGSRGTLFNSLVFIDDRGRLLGVHRKLIPTHAERLVWGQGDASTLTAYETAVGRIGGLVCWEHWMPLARFAMHASGEQIHVAASAGPARHAPCGQPALCLRRPLLRRLRWPLPGIVRPPGRTARGELVGIRPN